MPGSTTPNAVFKPTFFKDTKLSVDPIVEQQKPNQKSTSPSKIVSKSSFKPDNFSKNQNNDQYGYEDDFEEDEEPEQPLLVDKLYTNRVERNVFVPNIEFGSYQDDFEEDEEPEPKPEPEEEEANEGRNLKYNEQIGQCEDDHWMRLNILQNATIQFTNNLRNDNHGEQLEASQKRWNALKSFISMDFSVEQIIYSQSPVGLVQDYKRKVLDERIKEIGCQVGSEGLVGDSIASQTEPIKVAQKSVQSHQANHSIFMDLPPTIIGDKRRQGDKRLAEFLRNSLPWLEHCLNENLFIAGVTDSLGPRDVNEIDEFVPELLEEEEEASDEVSKDKAAGNVANTIDKNFCFTLPGPNNARSPMSVAEDENVLRIPLVTCDNTKNSRTQTDHVRGIMALEKIDDSMVALILCLFPIGSPFRIPACMLAMPFLRDFQRQKITSSILLKSSSGPFLLILGTSIGAIYMYEFGSLKAANTIADVPFIQGPIFRSDHPRILDNGGFPFCGEIKTITWHFDPSSLDLYESGQGYMIDDEFTFAKFTISRSHKKDHSWSYEINLERAKYAISEFSALGYPRQIVHANRDDRKVLFLVNFQGKGIALVDMNKHKVINWYSQGIPSDSVIIEGGQAQVGFFPIFSPESMLLLAIASDNTVLGLSANNQKYPSIAPTLAPNSVINFIRVTNRILALQTIKLDFLLYDLVSGSLIGRIPESDGKYGILDVFGFFGVSSVDNALPDQIYLIRFIDSARKILQVKLA